MRGLAAIAVAVMLYARFGPRPGFLPLATRIDGPAPAHASGVIVFLHGRGGSVTRAEGVAQQLREAGLPADFAIVLVEGPYSTGFGHHWGDSAQEQATTRARLRARLRQVLGDGGPPPGRAQYIELDEPHTLPPEVLRALVAFATAT